MVSRAGMTPPRAPFRAASWKDWGEKSAEPALGDIVVLTRPGSFHVGILLRLTLTEVWLLGGNQNQAVSVARYDASRIVTIRRAVK